MWVFLLYMHQVTVQAATFSLYSHHTASPNLLCVVSWNTWPLAQNSKWKIFAQPDTAAETDVLPEPLLTLSQRCEHLGFTPAIFYRINPVK